MADEKTLGLNTGEAETPAGDGQPEQKTKEVTSPEVDALSNDLDRFIGEDVDDKGLMEIGDDDETLVISKTKLEKLQKDRDNYREGLKSVKGKLKDFKKQDKPEDKPKPKQQPKGDFLKRSDYYKAIEKQAISTACLDESLEKNWSEIIPFYSPRRGIETVDDIVADLKDAQHLFNKNNPTETEEDPGVLSDLSADNAKQVGASTSGDKQKKRKHILPRRTPVQEWYGKVEEKK